MDTTKTDRRRKENRSEESRKAQTAAAVAASKQSRKTPREKGRENELKVLRWLADWGFTSPLLLSKLVGSQSVRRIEKNGLIDRVETGSVYYPTLYRLSNLGLQFATELVDIDAEDRYDEIDLSRIRLDKARHELTAQHLTLDNKGGFFPNTTWLVGDHWTERQFADLFTDDEGNPIYAKNAKLPDVVWTVTDMGDDGGETLKIAVEVELTKKGSIEPNSKTRYRLDQFILRVLHSINTGKVDSYIIASRNQGILGSYQNAMTPGRTYRTWEKDKRGHWQPDKEIIVPDFAATQIIYHHITDDGRRL